MTTKVTVFNHGPDKISVSVVSHNGNASEPTALQAIPQAPGTSSDHYVHLYQRLLITEIKD